jgi:hypothetical protein
VTRTRSHVEERGSLLTERLGHAGRLLWVGGSMIGPDRVSGSSKQGFGDERVVGLGIVAQIAGDLGSGSLEMLRLGNTYAAMALLRQLVEVDYLLWAFANDDEDARRWLNATDDDLWQVFRPHALRKRSGGTFRAEQYRLHCKLGGHPSPHARHLLADHSVRVEPSLILDDCALHLEQICERLDEAVDAVGYGNVVSAVDVHGEAPRRQRAEGTSPT